jgi:hypothetical protein
MITVCTPKDDNANVYKIPKLKSQITSPKLIGITIHPANANPKVNTGESIKIKKFARFGRIDSLRRSFSPSAIG